MAASNIRAGGAFVEMFVKDGTVQKTLNSVKRQLTTFGQGIRSIGLGSVGLGTAIGAPLVAAVASFAEAGAAVDDMAQRTGVGSAAIQELSFAAGQSATDIEALEKGLVKMQRTVAMAASGSKEAQQALHDLGVSADSLKSLSPDQQFEAMADGIAKITDPAKRTAAAMAVFGKGGSELIPVLALGSAGIEKFRAEARALGVVMDTSTIQAAADLDDGLHKLTTTFGAVKNAFGAAIAGPALAFMDFLSKGATSVTNFVNENRSLVVGVGALAAALVAGGAALVGIGTLIQVIGFAVGGLATAFTAFGTVMTFIASSPVLAVVGALTLLTLAFPALRNEAAGVFQFLFGGFTQLGDIVDQTLGGIVDALSAGDISAAANVLWAGLKAAWAQGTEQLRAVWRQLVNNIAGFGIDAFAALSGGWATMIKFFGDTWDALVGGMGGSWSDFQNWIAQGFANALGKITGIPQADIRQSLQEEQNAQKAAGTERKRQRESELEEKLKAIEAERLANRESLGEIKAAEDTQAQQALENAKAELAALRQQAAESKQNSVDKLRKDTRGRIDTRGVGEQFSSIVGSFSSAIASRSAVGGVSPLQKATEGIEKNTEDTVAAIKSLEGLSFT